MANASGEKKLIALWKQTIKSRKLFCDRQEFNYTSFISWHKEQKAKAKTETCFSQTQKTLRRITDPYYYYAGLEIMRRWKLYDIKTTPALHEILQHYIALNPDSEYVFPILKRDTNILQDRDIMWSWKKYNKRLKQVATLWSIEQNLTSYVSCHSLATHALLMDVPVNAISAMLGHSSLKTTEICLKSLPNDILDKYIPKILNAWKLYFEL